MPEKQRILIVDDSPSNIKVLNEILKSDYIINIATSGEKAFSILEQCTPDLIILDIMMPGMNGYEVCSLIKKKPTLVNVPVVFITSKSDISDEERGFQVGAVDYITKPVSPPLVKARVKIHLLIKKQQDLLRQSISILEHRAELLQHKAELGMLAAGLAHDINNILFVAMMIDAVPSMLPDDLETKPIIEDSIKNVMVSLSMGRDICRGFTSYLNDFGEEKQIQSFSPLLTPLTMFVKTFKVKLYTDISSSLPYIECKGAQIKRVIVNLFINACQAIEGQEEKKIFIRAWAEDDRLYFSIKDNGPGIPEDILPHIFEEHYTTRKDGNGLGLSMVKKILKTHHGTVECITSKGDGAMFTCSLPAITDS
ncbi:putative Response regulator receiver sensor signal transduction histidine kinase [Desulfamplus magnetovallimortis]|uniref:histidine kinase n=1 Tax=Desulfamplus magnetovallimortis TaxID=1246637 RepID=A0A1W1HIQ1_9BACT|nr:hybrid sensor histidine kinase/response regulator [Desulfamplus magnetovallimortis]SLM32397.1 putative Response regulator receiver sensor signal transduction histidine kinase [Desulfamplus magnetovallimortis]